MFRTGLTGYPRVQLRLGGGQVVGDCVCPTPEGQLVQGTANDNKQ